MWEAAAVGVAMAGSKAFWWGPSTISTNYEPTLSLWMLKSVVQLRQVHEERLFREPLQASPNGESCSRCLASLRGVPMRQAVSQSSTRKLQRERRKLEACFLWSDLE